MSLITRCPVCGTLFNVVADQLKVSQGWVRCGQCADVFDAGLHLQDKRAEHDSAGAQFMPAEQPLQPIASTDVNNGSYAENVAALRTEDNHAAFNSDPPLALPLASEAEEAEQVKAQAVADAHDDISMQVPSAISNAISNAILNDISNDIPIEITNNRPGDVPVDFLNGVSFVREARQQAFWRRRLVRVGLSLVAVVLICLLAAQYAAARRDSLAVIEPRLAPALQMLCEQLACRVSPVQQIEAIVIDSSSFNKINEAGNYRLSVTVKNIGASAVAMPSLEVTLTDTQDQPVLRRVLSPAQLGVANSMLAAGGDWSGAASLQVLATAMSPDNAAPGVLGRIAGYRLLAFYP